MYWCWIINSATTSPVSVSSGITGTLIVAGDFSQANLKEAMPDLQESPQTLMNFYCRTIEGLTAWYGNRTTRPCKEWFVRLNIQVLCPALKDIQ